MQVFFNFCSIFTMANSVHRLCSIGHRKFCWKYKRNCPFPDNLSFVFFFYYSPVSKSFLQNISRTVASYQFFVCECAKSDRQRDKPKYLRSHGCKEKVNGNTDREWDERRSIAAMMKHKISGEMCTTMWMRGKPK